MTIDPTSVHDGVLYGENAMVKALLLERVPHIKDFEPYAQALGVVRDNRLVGGAVFHNYRGHDIDVSFALDDRRALTRKVLRRLFWHPFVRLDCIRMTAVTGTKNRGAKKLLLGLGFEHEGTHPFALDGEQDAMTFGILRANCRWIEG